MTIPKPLPVRFSDRINFTGGEVYVPEIHLILDFEGTVEKKRLHRSLRLLLDAEPVIGCRFVDHWRKPYWMRLSDEEFDGAKLM